MNGKITVKKFPILKRRFQIPLLSSVVGVLIPADQFILIPSQSMYNVLLELTLDKHAMFTTGYRDIH